MIKRSLILASVIFFIVAGFIPVIKCGEKDVSKKVCDAMGLCKTDYYVSALAFIGGPCDDSLLSATAILFLMLIGSLLLGYLADLLYSRYRDN
jgi:hypothetical protein